MTNLIRSARCRYNVDTGVPRKWESSSDRCQQTKVSLRSVYRKPTECRWLRLNTRLNLSKALAVDRHYGSSEFPGHAPADIYLTRSVAPLSPDLAWETECLLLKIFEYGDYSFRSALLGRYSETLTCTFALARHRNALIGAAGCLHSRVDPTVAILGPVGVAREYRRNGIGAQLVHSIVDYLKKQGCMAVYLGVSRTNPAVRLYEAAGFRRYQGIVMRLLLSCKKEFWNQYFDADPNSAIRRIAWGDFPAVQALSTWPGVMYTVDLSRGIFSSRYCEPKRFLSVFPSMMQTFAAAGGFANALVAGERRTIVGFAKVQRMPAQIQCHVAELDLFVHDNFLAKAMELTQTTIRQCEALSIKRVCSACLSCDDVKREILERIGGRHVATLPGQVLLDGEYHDLLTYQMDLAPSKERGEIKNASSSDDDAITGLWGVRS